MNGRTIQAIDHLLTYVQDLDVAASLFRRMGFTLSPLSHIEVMGISNHLVPMRPLGPGFANYIELMAASDRTKLPPAMAQTLSGHEGIKSMVLAAEDAVVAQKAMRDQGFAAAPPVHVRREWVIAPGESVFPEFDVILPFPTALTFNCCQYHNVGLYLRPEWLEHANGALGIRSVFAVAEDPVSVVGRFAKLFGEPVAVTDGAARTGSGGVELAVFTPAGARAQLGFEVVAPETGAAYLGYRIEVSALHVLTSFLRKGGVPHRVDANAVCVDPVAGLGNLIVFTEKNGPR
ncbi:MAG: VOC family protein [Proteobacteria bacterium]|nr:VOC family protein [Pseudomonadota bacterium]